MKPQITVNIVPAKSSSYSIWIKSDLLQHTHWLPPLLHVEKMVIITDYTVKKLYADTLVKNLTQAGYRVLLLAIPGGEKAKTEATKLHLVERMLKQQCGRDTLCIALGGGVIGDLTGYLAATYMRGIPYIQIPTTLLAMVDSSVGGKTGINTAYGKNLIGAFWQPAAVIADVHCLRSLPKKQLLNGLIEALKMFLTHDKNSFFYLQKNLDRLLSYDEKCLQHIIHRAISIKTAIVEQDEKEAGLRMTLNFGHTIGHTLEHISQYKMLHGYAVAYGMLVEAKIAYFAGILQHDDYLILQAMLARLGFTADKLKKFSIDTILQATRLDKKSSTGKPRYVLLQRIGQVYKTKQAFAHHVPDSLVKKAFL